MLTQHQSIRIPRSISLTRSHCSPALLYLNVLALLCFIFSGQAFCDASHGLIIAGDNMPFYGDYLPCGFIKMVRKTCQEAKMPFTVTSMTWGGNRSNQLVDKLISQSSVWKRKGNTLLLVFGQIECLIKYGLPQEETGKSLTRLLSFTQGSGVRLILSSVPAWHPDFSAPQAQRLTQLNRFLKDFAVTHQVDFIDFAQIMKDEEKAIQQRFNGFAGRIFQVKEFSLNAYGDLIMAESILKHCCGTNDAQLNATRHIRTKLYTYGTSFNLTTKDFKELSRCAWSEGLTVSEYVRSKIKEDLD